MNQLKIFGAIFALTMLASIIALFFAFGSSGGARLDFSPGRDTGGGDVLGLTILLSCILGGIFGSVVGTLSVVYLAIMLNIFGERKLPIWTDIIYSAAVGFFVFLFFFATIWNRNLDWASLFEDIRHEWVGLTMCFLSGFLIVLVPIVTTKKYFSL